MYHARFTHVESDAELIKDTCSRYLFLRIYCLNNSS